MPSPPPPGMGPETRQCYPYPDVALDAALSVVCITTFNIDEMARLTLVVLAAACLFGLARAGGSVSGVVSPLTAA